MNGMVNLLVISINNVALYEENVFRWKKLRPKKKKYSQGYLNSLKAEVKQLQEQNKVLLSRVVSFSQKNSQKDKQISF
jgi:hypothetical protein